MGIGASSYIDNVINGFNTNYVEIIIRGNKIKDIINFVEMVDHFYNSDYIMYRDDSILETAKLYFSEEIIKSLKSHNKIEFHDDESYENFMNILDILIRWDAIDLHEFYSKMCIVGLQLGEKYAEYANCSITRNIMNNNTNIFERKKAIVNEFYKLSPSSQLEVFNNIIHGLKYHIFVYYDSSLYEIESESDSEDSSDKIEIVDEVYSDPRYKILISSLDDNKICSSYLFRSLINHLYNKGVKSLTRANMNTKSFEILMDSITLYICKFGLFSREILINRIFDKMDYELLFKFIKETPSPRQILRSRINNSNNYLKKYIDMLISIFINHSKLSINDYEVIYDKYFGFFKPLNNEKIREFLEKGGVIYATSDNLDLCLKANKIERIIILSNKPRLGHE